MSNTKKRTNNISNVKTLIKICVILLTLASGVCGASTNAKTFLDKGLSDTEAIKAAMVGSSRVIIPDIGRPWVIQPIILHSDLRLELQGKCRIQADTSYTWGPSDCLFRANGCKNIQIVGPQATLDMQGIGKPDGEWRMAISFNGCKNVSITGMSIVSPAGDGVYLGYGCEKVRIKNVTVRDSWRNGISITGAKDVDVKYCNFYGCGVGNSAKCAVDIEPNAGQSVDDILIQDCFSQDSAYWGFNVNTGDRPCGTVTLQDCCAQGGQYGFGINGPNRGGAADILLKNCTASQAKSYGLCIKNKEVGSRLRFNGSTLEGALGSVNMFAEKESGVVHFGGATFDKQCEFLGKVNVASGLVVEQVKGLP